MLSLSLFLFLVTHSIRWFLDGQKKRGLITSPMFTEVLGITYAT
jgi:hypothetical protein